MGGNVFKNVVPVKCELIEPTVLSLLSAVGISRQSVKLLGSAGKKPYSNDIDIAVEMDADQQAELFALLKQVINDHDVRKVGGNISIPWQIAGTTEYVQVDFIFGNVKWLSFFYHSPAESNLKGAHRNVALSTLAGYTDRLELSDEKMPNGNSVHVQRWKWSSRDGLVYIERSHPEGRNGTRIKTAKEKILSEQLRSPNSVAHVLFNGKLSDKYLDSAELVIEAIDKIYCKADADIIFDRMAKNFCEHHDLRKQTWNYPDRIMPFIEHYQSEVAYT